MNKDSKRKSPHANENSSKYLQEKNSCQHPYYSTKSNFTAKEYAFKIDAAMPYITEYNEEQKDMLDALEEALDEAVAWKASEAVFYSETRQLPWEEKVYRWIRILRAHLERSGAEIEKLNRMNHMVFKTGEWPGKRSITEDDLSIQNLLATHLNEDGTHTLQFDVGGKNVFLNRVAFHGDPDDEFYWDREANVRRAVQAASEDDIEVSDSVNAPGQEA